MDEDQSTQTEALNESAAEDSSQNTPPVDETTTSEATDTDSQSEQTQIKESDAEATNEAEERKPTRAERRIRQLSDKVKEAERSSQQFNNFEQPPEFTPDENGEISMDQYRQHVAQEAQRTANQVVQQQLSHERAVNNFDKDVDILPREYPELDENSDSYNAAMEQAVTDEFQEKAYRVVGIDPITGQPQYRLDPNVRLADIAKRYVNVARAAAQNSSARMQQAVEQTQDTTSPRPTGGQRQDRSVEDMSIKEIEQKYGFAG